MGTTADLEDCTEHGHMHCFDSGVKSWGTASSHDVIESCAYGLVPMLVHAVVRYVIRLSDRHETLGTTADLRICT